MLSNKPLIILIAGLLVPLALLTQLVKQLGASHQPLSHSASNMPELVKDIGWQGANSNPEHCTITENEMFFFADDGIQGRALWKSDGTYSNTLPLKNITPDTPADRVNIRWTTTLNDKFLFENYSFWHSSDQLGTWSSDGTLTGTILLHEHDTSYDFVKGDGAIFFSVYDDGEGKNLLKTNGTVSGTIEIKNFEEELGDLYFENSMLFFFGYDGTNRGLWRSDGTLTGTILLKEFESSIHFSTKFGIQENNGMVYFAIWDEERGFYNQFNEIWRTDGTISGTTFVKTLGGFSAPLVTSDGIYIFGKSDTDEGLWKINHPTSEPIFIEYFPINSALYPTFLGATNSHLFFAIYDGWSTKLNGAWSSNGSSDSIVQILGFDFYSYESIEFNNDFIISGSDLSRSGLWKTNGSLDGIILVKELASPPVNSYKFPDRFYELNNRLFFEFDNTLWISNGTEEGTIPVTSDGKTRECFQIFQDEFYFGFEPNSYGDELWQSNGTVSGTLLHKDINSTTVDSHPYYLFNYYGSLIFGTQLHAANNVWKSNGTDIGTILITDSFGFKNPTIFNNELFFWSSDTLLKTNGTSEGTAIIEQFRGYIMSDPIKVNDELFFVEDTGFRGYDQKLLRNNFTSEGTEIVIDFGEEYLDNWRNNLVEFNGTIAFHTGNKLWRTNSVITKTLTLDSGSYVYGKLVIYNNAMYFLASNYSNDTCGLWKTDTAFTEITPVISVSTSSTCPHSIIIKDGTKLFLLYREYTSDNVFLWSRTRDKDNMIQIGEFNSIYTLGSGLGKLFFAADDGVHGVELWQSDGTVTGTILLKDINPGSGNSNPESFIFIPKAGKLFFTADDGVHGQELWQSDGTGDNIMMVADINLGNASSTPDGFTYIKPNLYFAATEVTTGRELWRLTVPPQNLLFLPVLHR